MHDSGLDSGHPTSYPGGTIKFRGVVQSRYDLRFSNTAPIYVIIEVEVKIKMRRSRSRGPDGIE